MKKWLGPCLVAAREIKALGPAAGEAAGTALGRRLRVRPDEDPLGPATTSHGPLPPPPRPYSQAHDCAAAVDVSVGRDPALGLAWLGLSAEGAPVVQPLLPPPRGLSLRLTRSSGDPALTEAPPLTACLAPWTGSQTSRACSRSYSCSKTRSRPTQPHSVSCRMYPSFLLGLQAGENGDHPLFPRLFLQCLGAGLGRELRMRI